MQISGEKVKSFLGKDRRDSDIPDAQNNFNLNPRWLNYLRAIELARLGCYSEAEQFLLEASKEKVLKTVVLDLRAKMFAQQGRYSEAEVCWLEALSLEPGNPQYRRALDTLASSGRNVSWGRLVMIAVLTAIAAMGIFAVFMLGYNLGDIRYRNLQQRFAESEKRMVVSMERLSGKVTLLQKERLEYEKEVKKQLSGLTGMQKQRLESEKTLGSSVNGLSQKFDSFDNDMKQKISEQSKSLEALDKKTDKDKGWIAGLGRILFAPIDFVFNLGKRGHSSNDNSSTQSKSVGVSESTESPGQR